MDDAPNWEIQGPQHDLWNFPFHRRDFHIPVEAGFKLVPNVVQYCE